MQEPLSLYRSVYAEAVHLFVEEFQIDNSLIHH